MTNKVTVTARPKEDHIVVSENNDQYGYIRVQQKREMFNESGFLEIKPVSALVLGKVENLKALKWFNGLEVQGKIVIREQLVPFSKVNPDQHLKLAGDTKVVCMSGDQPIYRNTYFSSDTNAKDVLVPHSNSDEIKAAAEKLAQMKEEFSLDN